MTREEELEKLVQDMIQTAYNVANEMHYFPGDMNILPLERDRSNFISGARIAGAEIFYTLEDMAVEKNVPVSLVFSQEPLDDERIHAGMERKAT